MKVLNIGLGKNLFGEEPEARRRQIEYGNLCEELHVLTLYSGQDTQISRNVWIYGTIKGMRIIRLCHAFRKAREIIKRNGINFITTQDPFFTGFIGWIIKRKFKIPLQVQIHTDFLSPYFWKESFLNKIRVLIAKFLIPKADCIRVVSERIKKSLLRVTHSPLRITILPIFVDIKKIQAAPRKTDLHKKYPQFEFIILMASRLTKEKNIGLAIKAMAEIIKKHPKTGLVIAGDGPEKENLKFKIKNLNLSGNVILEPWTDDLASYYKTADLFLLTSNYEGYGMAVVEAMAAGCPVITTDVGLAGEILINKKDGLVVSVGDKNKLTDAILALVENPGLRAELVRNAVKTLSFWLSREEYLNAYRDSWLICRSS